MYDAIFFDQGFLATGVVSEIGNQLTEESRSLSQQVGWPVSLLTTTDLILTRLSMLHSECKVGNWDGYEAKPVDEGTINNALELAISLCDKGLSIPEFTPDPDGEIALEWYGDDNSVASVSVGSSSLITYAAVRSDEQRTNGTMPFKKESIDGLVKQIALHVR